MRRESKTTRVRYTRVTSLAPSHPARRPPRVVPNQTVLLRPPPPDSNAREHAMRGTAPGPIVSSRNGRQHVKCVPGLLRLVVGLRLSLLRLRRLGRLRH